MFEFDHSLSPFVNPNLNIHVSDCQAVFKVLYNVMYVGMFACDAEFHQLMFR